MVAKDAFHWSSVVVVMFVKTGTSSLRSEEALLVL